MTVDTTSSRSTITILETDQTQVFIRWWQRQRVDCVSIWKLDSSCHQTQTPICPGSGIHTSSTNMHTSRLSLSTSCNPMIHALLNPFIVQRNLKNRKPSAPHMPKIRLHLFPTQATNTGNRFGLRIPPRLLPFHPWHHPGTLLLLGLSGIFRVHIIPLFTRTIELAFHMVALRAIIHTPATPATPAMIIPSNRPNEIPTIFPGDVHNFRSHCSRDPHRCETSRLH